MDLVQQLVLAAMVRESRVLLCLAVCMFVRAPNEEWLERRFG